MIVKQSIQLQNQLEKIIYQHFAEALVYCRLGMPKWLLNVVNKYPSAKDICKAGITKLIKIKGVSEQRAKGLIKKAIAKKKIPDRLPSTKNSGTRRPVRTASYCNKSLEDLTGLKKTC